MSRDEVLCSVELLNLREIESKRQLCKAEPPAFLCTLPKKKKRLIPTNAGESKSYTPAASLQRIALLVAELLLSPSACCPSASAWEHREDTS